MVLGGDVPSDCNLASFRHARFFDFFNEIRRKRPFHWHDSLGTTQFDAELTFMASAGGRIRQEAFSSSRELVEQCLCFFQIGGVGALGEPAVNWRQQLARLDAPSLVAPQPRKARRGAQFERARLLRPCHL
jgi:hypothetical protein